MMQYGKSLSPKQRLVGLLVAELVIIPWVLLKLVIEISALDMLLRLLLGVIWLWIPLYIYRYAKSRAQGKAHRLGIVNRLGIITSALLIGGTWLLAILLGLGWLFLQTITVGQISYWIEPQPGKIYKVSDRPYQGPSFGAGCRIIDPYDRLLPGLLYAKGPVLNDECYETWSRHDLPPRLTALPSKQQFLPPGRSATP
jgi:hypothetical protein